jgi:hypothetical protein
MAKFLRPLDCGRGRLARQKMAQSRIDGLGARSQDDG